MKNVANHPAIDSSGDNSDNSVVWFPVCYATDVGSGSNETLIGLKTTESRDCENECSICYYDSADSDDHNTDIDEKISQETLHLTHRYAQMFKKNKWAEDSDYVPVCQHQFHTICLYQWFEKSKKVTCPMCKQGATGDPKINLPPLFKKPPRFVTTYYENGCKKVCYFEINGQKHGPYEKYNQQGQLMIKKHYQDDQLHGYEYEYYPYTGKVRSKTKWSNGKRHGLHWVRTSIGFWITKAEYQNDLLHGDFREWFEGTHILRKGCSYDQGQLHGVLREWDNNQNLVLYSTYYHGTQWGRHMENYSNGVPHLKSFYNKQGELDGIRIEYFKNKDIKSIQYYSNGEPVQMNRKYYSNGLTAAQGEYYEYEKDNTWTEWYRNGNVKTQCTYENGMLYGNFVRCTEQGDLIESGEYENNEIHGKHIVMYPNRIPNLVEHYHYGVLHGSRVVYDKNGFPATKTAYNHGELEGNFYDLATGIKCQYVNGQLDGKWCQMVDGVVLMDANFVEGELHGECKKITEDGNYITTHYHYGQLLD